MAKKLLNGYTAIIAVVLTAMVLYTGTIVWGVRLEGKTEVNKVNITHVAEDIGEIKGDIKTILEKL